MALKQLQPKDSTQTQHLSTGLHIPFLTEEPGVPPGNGWWLKSEARKFQELSVPLQK